VHWKLRGQQRKLRSWRRSEKPRKLRGWLKRNESGKKRLQELGKQLPRLLQEEEGHLDQEEVSRAAEVCFCALAIIDWTFKLTFRLRNPGSIDSDGVWRKGAPISAPSTFGTRISGAVCQCQEQWVWPFAQSHIDRVSLYFWACKDRYNKTSAYEI
jgi:hypothetical protein